METMEIEIKKINIKDNIRLKKEEIGILMESINQHGLLEPIGVEKVNNSSYNLVYGHRRFEACKKLGYKKILAVVRNIDTDDKRIIENAIENIQRKSITPYELGKVCNILNDKGYNINEISALLNMPISKLKGSVLIYNKMPKKYAVQTEFSSGTKRKGKISASVAISASRIRNKINITDKQFDELMEYIKKENCSFSTMEILASLIKRGIDIKSAVKTLNDWRSCEFRISIKKSAIDRITGENDIPMMKLLIGVLTGKYDLLKESDIISRI